MTIRYSPARPPGAPDAHRGDDWRDQAACAGHWATFWAAMPAQPYGAAQDPAAEARALAICDTCPVREACRAKLDPADDQWNIAGGTTPRQRDAKAHGEPVPPPEPGPDQPCPQCGQTFTTRSGLGKHYRAKHPGKCLRGHELPKGGPCRACRNRNNRRQMRARRVREAA